ncbi:MAG TPA: hypothetical protein VGL38_14480 [bacterium]|jgi:hypothetical protein
MRHLILLFALCLFAAVCYAQSEFPNPTVGTRPGAFSSRSLSLGHAYLTDEEGPPAVMGNPAGLAEQTTRWRFLFSGNIARIKETRKYPVFDAFNAVLMYNNYALNDHLYSKMDGGIAYKLPTDAVQSLVLSLASFSAYSFDYTYHEEVRDRYASGGIMDLKLGENDLDVSGDLRTISLAAAAKMHGPLSLGFAFNTLAGTWTYTRGVHYVSSDSANYADRVKYSNVGAPGELNFGAAYALGERLKFGARALMPTGEYKFKQNGTYAHEHDVHQVGIDTTLSAGGNVIIKYPKRFSAGLQFRPKSEFRPLLLLEGEIFTYHDTDPTLNNSFEIRAGVEHQVVPGAPVRFGYVYTTSPSDKEHASSLFTAGIGFAVHKVSVDFGVEMGTVNYVSTDMFPQTLYGGVNRTDKDHVETDVFRGMLTLKYDL